MKIVKFALLAAWFFAVTVSGFAQISGKKNVGPGQTYETIADAVAALSAGVSGSVVFRLVDGVYDEAVTINGISGSSPTNEISFVSLSGTPEAVTINGGFTLNGAKNMTFSNLTIRPSDSHQEGIRIESGTDSIRVEGCRFVSDDGSFQTRSGISCVAAARFLSISNSTFDSLNTGVWAQSASGQDTVIISGNSMTDCVTGIAVMNYKRAEIEENHVEGRTVYGISATYTTPIIRKNNVYADTSNSFVHGIELAKLNTTDNDSGHLVNNRVMIKNAGTANGMYLDYSSNYLNIFHNTVITIDNTNGYPFRTVFRVGGVAPQFLTIKNNIFLTSTQTALRTNYDISSFSWDLDFNNVRGGVGTIPYLINLSTYSLSSMQSTFGQQFNGAFAEFTYNPKTLELTGASISDPNLLGTPLSSVTDDFDGDARSPVYPTMGADEGTITVPVEMSAWSILEAGDDLILQWETKTEVNNFGWEIERKNSEVRSQKSGEWETIGFVAGNGTTNSPELYSFQSPITTHQSQYRLKQIDLDGQFSYSPVLEYNPSVMKFSLNNVYPNPFNPSTTIDFSLPVSGTVKLRVFSLLGQIVMEKSLNNLPAGRHTMKVDGSRLSTGTYILQIQSGSVIESRRITLLK